MTIPIGLGIGRLVFRALNAAEAMLAIVVIVAVATGSPGPVVVALTVVAAVVLAIQIAVVRPRSTAGPTASCPERTRRGTGRERTSTTWPWRS